MNSLDAFRGVFGINQLASRIFTSAEDLSDSRAFGVTSRGALKVIDLAMYRMPQARGRRTKAGARTAAEDSIMPVVELAVSPGRSGGSAEFDGLVSRDLETCIRQGCLRISQPG